MFSGHKAEIPTIRQLKIMEEVKKLVDEMKNLYKCNINRTNSRKANKTIENFKESSLSLLIALFPVRVARAAAQDYATTLNGFPSIPSFRLGEVPNNSTQDPQCNIDSSTVVLGRPAFFSHSLW